MRARRSVNSTTEPRPRFACKKLKTTLAYLRRGGNVNVALRLAGIMC